MWRAADRAESLRVCPSVSVLRSTLKHEFYDTSRVCVGYESIHHEKNEISKQIFEFVDVVRCLGQIRT